MREFDIREGYEAMDFPRVREMLSRAFWCTGIGEEEIRAGAANSALVVGAFSPEGVQVGFARAISDKVRFAYILDVYVDEDWRGRGIASAMMRRILGHPSLASVYQWLLITKDA
ncbi:MAG TPA: GNAT family N-acetyltransferase, partial [Rectinemataceae bacterium]